MTRPHINSENLTGLNGNLRIANHRAIRHRHKRRVASDLAFNLLQIGESRPAADLLGTVVSLAENPDRSGLDVDYLASLTDCASHHPEIGPTIHLGSLSPPRDLRHRGHSVSGSDCLVGSPGVLAPPVSGNGTSASAERLGILPQATRGPQPSPGRSPPKPAAARSSRATSSSSTTRSPAQPSTVTRAVHDIATKPHPPAITLPRRENQLQFSHPSSGERMAFTCGPTIPPPPSTAKPVGQAATRPSRGVLCAGITLAQARQVKCPS